MAMANSLHGQGGDPGVLLSVQGWGMVRPLQPPCCRMVFLRWNKNNKSKNRVKCGQWEGTGLVVGVVFPRPRGVPRSLAVPPQRQIWDSAGCCGLGIAPPPSTVPSSPLPVLEPRERESHTQEHREDPGILRTQDPKDPGVRVPRDPKDPDVPPPRHPKDPEIQVPRRPKDPSVRSPNAHRTLFSNHPASKDLGVLPPKPPPSPLVAALSCPCSAASRCPPARGPRGSQGSGSGPPGTLSPE